MIRRENPILQAFLGTLLTCTLTAVGAATVFIFKSTRFNEQRKIFDFSLGFASGVMTSASFWSLLGPSIEMAERSLVYGARGEYGWVPAAVGFVTGAGFMLLCDHLLPHFTRNVDAGIALALRKKNKTKKAKKKKEMVISEPMHVVSTLTNAHTPAIDEVTTYTPPDNDNDDNDNDDGNNDNGNEEEHRQQLNKYNSWKHMVLLVIAITVHNMPEGLAIGVSFGAVGRSPTHTFTSARNMVIGMCVQNIPEGMAVSVPLCAAGYSPLKSFAYGSLSGLVEPVFGVVGAAAVVVGQPLLPYLLSFAAGVMVYVVVDALVPEAHGRGNGRIASWGMVVGFVVMMCLDVGTGKI